MEVNVVMPKLGTAMTEGIIEKWCVKEGCSIKKGEILLEVMSDKAIIEVDSQVSGILSKIIKYEDETVPVGEVIAVITC